MSQVRFIGCLHFGHPAIHKMRGFDPMSGLHDEYLINCWNRVVHKKDLTYILGDVTMETDKYYYQLDRLNGRKIVVLGNHDLPKHTRKLLEYVDTVAGMVDYKDCVLTHAPIHPNEMGFCKYNIHAHIHNNLLHEVTISDRYNDEGHQIKPTLHKYICVDAQRIEYTPRLLTELI